jgi:hypothetical protein
VQIDPAAPIPEWDYLEMAFDMSAEFLNFYDRQTGEVVLFMPDGYGDDEQETTWQQVEADPQRFVKIEPVPSREKFMWMEAFVATVSDPRSAGRLEGALGGPRPFRRFKDSLSAYEVQRWYAFQCERLRRHVAGWLDAQGIAVGAAPPWPELADGPAALGSSVSG